jgi:hypothetical protein
MTTTYKTKNICLDGDRKLINAVKKAGLKTCNPQGKYNGYGYEKLPLHVILEGVGDVRKFNAIKKELDGETKKVKTDDERKTEWCNRLAKLTGISIEEATMIAEEKVAYKEEQIWKMNDKNCDNPSKERETLIRKMERENPLRRITDAAHANAILAAHDRHNNTDYEAQLDRARDLAEYGEIDRSEVKDFARINQRKASE